MGYVYNPLLGAGLDQTGAGGGGSTPAGGGDTQIQFNDGGTAFGGDADLTWNKTTNVLGITGDVNLSDGGTYTTTLQTITATANRTISLPDATGTVALVGGSSGQLVYNNAGANAGASTLTYDGSILTSSGRFINSYNSGSLAPAKAFTGTWVTGAGTTNTKPHVLIETTGATSNNWSNSGTGLGVNAASGFAGRLLDLQVNGTRVFGIEGTTTPTLLCGGTSWPTLGLSIVATNQDVTYSAPGSNGHVFGSVNLNAIRVASALAITGDLMAPGRNSATNFTFQTQAYNADIKARDIYLYGTNAFTTATTNIVGGSIFVAGGAGATSSSGAANGGNINLDGGQPAGTGIAGNIIIGATRGNLQITDARDIVLGTTTGTKIGTSTSQKIGFYNKTPVVQPAAVADATDAATAITQLNALLARMRDLGLIAT